MTSFKNPESLSLWAFKDVKSQRYDISLIKGEGVAFGKLVMEKIGPADYVPPFLSLRDDEAQQLMDELWRTGIRPSNGVGNEGQLAATQAHLKDMQLIAMGWVKTQIELSK